MRSTNGENESAIETEGERPEGRSRTNNGIVTRLWMEASMKPMEDQKEDTTRKRKKKPKLGEKNINDEKKTQNWMPMRETEDDENATFGGLENSYRKNRMFLRETRRREKKTGEREREHNALEVPLRP
ncbi:unnamed protein product [Lasius platythorax]|uniref:Uncharacterized protein n=1 Tax=Lasius platythorax TaxID=488582 RepID=A0AAV2P902_9HYME